MIPLINCKLFNKFLKFLLLILNTMSDSEKVYEERYD